MRNVAGNKGFIVGAASVQGTRFKEAGASQSLHYRREKGSETPRARSYRDHTGPRPHCPAGLGHLDERAAPVAPAPQGAPSFGGALRGRWGTAAAHHRPLRWPSGRDGWLEFSTGRKTTQRGKLTG